MTMFFLGMVVGVILTLVVLGWIGRLEPRSPEPPETVSPEAMARAEVLLHDIRRHREVDELRAEMQRRNTNLPPPLP